MSDLMIWTQDWLNGHFGSFLAPEIIDWFPSIVAFGVAAASIALCGWRWLWVPARRQSRLDLIAPGESEDVDDRTGLFGTFTPALAAQIPESKKERGDFQQLLRSAGLYSPHAASSIYAARFVLLVVPLMVAGIVAVVGDPENGLTTMILGGFVAGGMSIIPRLYVYFRRRKRIRNIRQGLPDTVDMLGMCIEGGLSLGESLDHVSSQLTNFPELAGELMILRRQAEVGSLQLALADFASRVDLQEVRQLANLLTRSDRLGTKLAGSLMGQANHLRVARRQMATTQANKTPVKLVLPVMFCFAPAALILLTGPAVLQLKEFLAPSSGQSVLTASPESFGPSALISTLNGLDQSTGANR